jgi:ankyrin repeat protein
MSYTKPILIISHQLKIPDSHLGQSITYDRSTPLHLAARHSNSAALIKELIQIHPPALRKLNRDGKTPICLVFENTTSMAPNILREFLLADRELIEIGNKENHNELPIHCCIRRGENPNISDFLSILVETNHDLVNVPTSLGLLPVHLAALFSTVEVVQELYKYSPSSINVIHPVYGSVAHIAARNQKIYILKYIHTINPELILLADNGGWTPLCSAVVKRSADCDFIKALYALGPTAISEVHFY